MRPTWVRGGLLAQAAIAAVWVPTFLLQPAAAGVRRNPIGVVALIVVFVWPIAAASGLLVGRTNDERRRLRWLVGMGLVAALASWLFVSLAGDAFTCRGRALAAGGRIACGSTLPERVAGVTAAEVAVVGQWILARREWYYRPGRPWPA